MNKITVATWAASLVVAFYTGYNSNQPTPQVNEHHIHSEHSTNSASSEQDSSKTQQKKSGTKRINPTSKSRPSVNVVLADLKALLGDTGMMSMDMAAFAESYNLVKDLNEEELIEALNQLLPNISHPGNMMPLMLLLGQYAEKDPINAMAFYEGNITSPQTKMMAMSSILSAWSKNDPEEAYEWFQENKSKNNAGGGMMGGNSMGMIYIFQGLAKKDLNSAVDKLKELDGTGFEAQMAASGIASALRDKKDFVDFIEKTSELDNKQIRNSVLQNWVMRNPQEVSEWVSTLEDPKEKKQFSTQILSGWMMSNPQEAANWHMDNADDKTKQKAANEIIQNWSYRDPKAAMTWLDNQEGLDKDKSVKKIISSSIYSNPNFAIDNLEKLSSDKDKKQLSQQIYAQLKRNSPKKAADFLEDSPFKEELAKNNKTEDLGDFEEL